MSSAETGRIIRRHVLKSPIKMEGFDWKQGARYVVINKEYTSDLQCLWGILPYRRKVNGTTPGMRSKDINSKEGNVEKQWVFPSSQLRDKSEKSKPDVQKLQHASFSKTSATSSRGTPTSSSRGDP